MKSYKQLFCVLLVVVLLFVTFSITANAESLDVSPYQVTMKVDVNQIGVGLLGSYDMYWRTDNGVLDRNELDVYGDLMPFCSYLFDTSYKFTPDNAPLIAKGGHTVVTMFEGYYGIGLENAYNHNFAYFRGVNDTKALISYVDGTHEYIEDINYSVAGNKINLSVEFEAKKDVAEITYYVHQIINIGDTNHWAKVYFGEWFGTDKGYDLQIRQESEEEGLLKGIISWLQNIKNGITDLFNSIAELPAKIWGFIEEGLKNLFVPDEQYMTEYSDKWDELLSQRFGAIYQVGGILSDFASRITASDETNTINMPVASLESVGIPFSFGGYEVQIVPDGFETVVEICKKLISIVCTLLFINGLRKRYDEVMGVEQ